MNIALVHLIPVPFTQEVGRALYDNSKLLYFGRVWKLVMD